MTLKELMDGLVRLDRERAWRMSMETFCILYDQSSREKRESIPCLAKALKIGCRRIREEYKRIEREILQGDFNDLD